MAQRVSPTVSEVGSNEQDLPKIVYYWIMRLLVELKGEQHFVSRHGFRDDDIAAQIGLTEFVSDNLNDELNPVQVRKLLRKLYQKAQSDKGAVPPVLAANVKRIAELVNLNAVETSLFTFTVLMRA